jgi:hypothetical protein
MTPQETDANGAASEPATIDSRSLRIVPIPSRRKAVLNTLEGVRREMARVYRDAESGKRDTAEASKLTYMLGQIGKVLELTEIERRLTLLEARNAR